MHRKKIYILAFIFTICITAIRANSPQAYIHTDRYCYVSGDIAFLKIYYPACFDENFSQTVYIDLLSPTHSFMYGELQKMKNGLSSGYFPIHDSLQTGYYTLRFYTEKSKNTAQQFLAQKKIYIANRFSESEKVYDHSGKNAEQINRTPQVSTKNCKVEFKKTTCTTRDQTFFKITNSTEDILYASISVKPGYTHEKELELKNNSIVQLHNSYTGKNKPDNNTFSEPGFEVSGKLLDHSTGKAIDKAIVFLSLQDSIIRLRYGITDTDGSFCFNLNGYHNQQTAYLTAFSSPDMIQLTHVLFELDNNFLNENGQGNTRKVLGQKPARDTLNVLKSIVNKAYRYENIIYEDIPLRDTLPLENIFLAGKITRTTYPGNYIKLKDFKEIALEILPLVKYKDTKKGYKLSIINGNPDKSNEHPIIFIDGVPTTDYALLANLNTDKIKRIDVRNQPRAFGDILFEDGMLFIWTKRSNFWSMNTHIHNPEIIIQCHQLPVKPVFPNYTNNNMDKNPDFRHILYWNPSVSLSSGESLEGSFFTSDEKGDFELILEGITNTGEPVYQRKTIHVK